MLLLTKKPNLCLVTATYSLRKTRPIDYYLVPTINLLNSLANTEIEICLFTNLPKESFPSAKNIEIIIKDVNEFAAEMWGTHDWKSQYEFNSKLTEHLPRQYVQEEERTVPEMLSLWLGKFPMMQYASQKAKNVLWQDSGVATGLLFNRKIEQYKDIDFNCRKYLDLLNRFKDKPLAFAKCFYYIHPYHRVNMEKYNKSNKPFLRAGFIFAKSKEIEKLKDKVSYYWKYLVDNNDFGSEENALTLYSWEREDIELLFLHDWMNLLGIEPKN